MWLLRRAPSSLDGCVGALATALNVLLRWRVSVSKSVCSRCPTYSVLDAADGPRCCLDSNEMLRRVGSAALVLNQLVIGVVYTTLWARLESVSPWLV